MFKDSGKRYLWVVIIYNDFDHWEDGRSDPERAGLIFPILSWDITGVRISWESQVNLMILWEHERTVKQMEQNLTG